MTNAALDARRRILDEAYGRFQRFGVRRVTMDEISQALHMSKKTLYRHFTGKREIVEELVRRDYSSHLGAVLEAVRDGRSAQDSFLAGFRRLGVMVGQTSPVFLADVRAEHPDIWEAFDALRSRVMAELARAVARGVERGEIRSSINPDIAAGILECVLRNYMVPDTFHNTGITPRQAWLTWITMVTSGLFREPLELAEEWKDLPVPEGGAPGEGGPFSAG